MDRMRDFAGEMGSDMLNHDAGTGDAQHDHAGIDQPAAIGTDERRMHVRAYNFWAQMLGERSYPAIDDLDLDALGDFGPNAVLLDFSAGTDNPAISFVGALLREECMLGDDIQYIADVPSRSLLSRLTDHYLQIIANQAPIGFEAEFVNERGINIAYRGILLPFSSDDDTIDFILGVINWKQVADVQTTSALEAEIEEALRMAPVASAPAPVWADGPAAPMEPEASAIAYPVRAIDDSDVLELVSEQPDADAGLADWLAFARDGAAQVHDADIRGRAALYSAVSRAHDFAVVAQAQPKEFAEMLDDAGLTAQDRAPMTPVVKLVFGADYDKTRLTEYATVLAHAARVNIARCGLADYLNQYAGGVKAIVKAERAMRRPTDRPITDKLATAQEKLRHVIPHGFVPFDAAQDSEFVVFVGRQIAPGQFAMVGTIETDQPLIDAAVQKAKTGAMAPHNPD